MALSLSCGAGLGADDDWFLDQTAKSGIDFQHFNGMTGRLYFSEMMGAGAAVLDYDQDGDLDVYLIQGNQLDTHENELVFAPRGPLRDHLYENLGNGADGKPRFKDVTLNMGVGVDDYGMAVSSGDINNDGLPDLYIGNFGEDRLLLNKGNGRFEDVTKAAGIDSPGWSSSSVFFDANNDGWLDLYVARYVDYTIANHKTCRSPSSRADYCSPSAYGAVADLLYINQGKGLFLDQSKPWGIGRSAAPGLGVISADFNADGWMDLYVANDGKPNSLWLNQDGAGFRDEAMLAGVGVNMNGQPEASMGVDAADFDRDGDEDLFMTHIEKETNTLFVNDGQGWFEDRSIGSGLAASSKSSTGWGTAWKDFDRDGDLDLFSANGAVLHIEHQVAAGVQFPLAQSNQLFLNDGLGRYQDASPGAGEAFSQTHVSRGASFGDLDNDGDVDILVTNNAGPASLLLNQLNPDGHWLGAQLRRPGNLPTEGSWLALSDNDLKGAQGQRQGTGGSYASASDPRVVFALSSATPAAIEVSWPDGTKERFSDLTMDQYHILIQGQGAPQ